MTPRVPARFFFDRPSGLKLETLTASLSVLLPLASFQDPRVEGGSDDSAEDGSLDGTVGTDDSAVGVPFNPFDLLEDEEEDGDEALGAVKRASDDEGPQVRGQLLCPHSSRTRAFSIATERRFAHLLLLWN